MMPLNFWAARALHLPIWFGQTTLNKGKKAKFWTTQPCIKAD